MFGSKSKYSSSSFELPSPSPTRMALLFSRMNDVLNSQRTHTNHGMKLHQQFSVGRLAIIAI